jgi:hypothetical protein
MGNKGVTYNLDTLEAGDKLVNLCKKYPGLEIDVCCGSYTVDGRSYLGVASIIGRQVEVKAIGREETIEDFYKEVQSI